MTWWVVVAYYSFSCRASRHFKVLYIVPLWRKKHSGSLSLMSCSLYAVYQALFLWLQEGWHSKGNRFFRHSFSLLSATVLGPRSVFCGLSSAQCQYLFDQCLTLWFHWCIAFEVFVLFASLALSCRCPSLFTGRKDRDGFIIHCSWSVHYQPIALLD